MKYIVSFSGGKDSTAMLLRLLEEGRAVDDIVFCDTTAEFPQMYEHIAQVEKYIGRKITILKAEHNFEYMMLRYEKKRGKNKGKKGYGWANRRARWCTAYFKREQVNRYLRGIGDEVAQYLGIAADEGKRIKHNKDGRRLLYPLVEWGMTEADCLQYCYDRGFTWGGLYEKFKRVSCYLCPFHRLEHLKNIWKYFPDLWEHMRNLDEKCIKQIGYPFRPNCSIADLEARFQREEEETQLDLVYMSQSRKNFLVGFWRGYSG